jgi:hypothetical protein
MTDDRTEQASGAIIARSLWRGSFDRLEGHLKKPTKEGTQ